MWRKKTNILLSDGRFALKGSARVQTHEAKGITALFRGSASFSRLVVKDSLSNGNILTWKQLHLDRIDAGFNPLFVKIRTISLRDFFASLVVEEDGTLNLQQIVKKSPDAGEKPGDEKENPAPPADCAGPGCAGSPRTLPSGRSCSRLEKSASLTTT